ncbi:MAG: HD domain-containing protein, partial [Flavobacteriaceae bacterium]|nr:HD domain-containing protein [Flavobacteriaceae bacterium]
HVLRSKSVAITDAEEEALYIAILLHDIGHGPFSHALEHTIAEDIDHEKLSLLFMQELNLEFDGKLDLAISIFQHKYKRKFLHQLVSGQLDMDRLDYLRRDSFYTGVPEGNINSQRLIVMLNVKDDQLVVEEKGVYSVEKFIVSRRLMYWQVYLHKTSLVAEQLLLRLLQRAKELSRQGIAVPASSALSFFLKRTTDSNEFDLNTLKVFAQLDDYDIISAMKEWVHSEDFVLSEISKMILNRQLLKIKVKNKPVSEEKVEKKTEEVANKHNLSLKEASYFVFRGAISNQAYRMDKDTINLIGENGKVVDVAKASDQLNIEALSQEVVKYYLCYPKSH